MIESERSSHAFELKLKSKDGQFFTVQKDVAVQMKFVEDLVAEIDVPDGKEIPIGEVEGVILKKIIEFCDFHHKHPLSRDTIEEIDNWEKEFVQVEKSILFRMMLVCLYSHLSHSRVFTVLR